MRLPSYDDALRMLSERLSEKNLAHSVSTAAMAAKLAERYFVDREKARLAGLLHDWSRCVPIDRMLAEAQAQGIAIEEVERANPYLVHAALSARQVRGAFPGLPADVLDAIERHTFGAPGMSDLDKVVYLADMLEPRRTHPGLVALRAAIDTDPLEELFRKAYAHSMTVLAQGRRHIHPRTLEVWNTLVAGGRR